jgi:hypothetical protein
MREDVALLNTGFHQTLLEVQLNSHHSHRESRRRVQRRKETAGSLFAFQRRKKGEKEDQGVTLMIGLLFGVKTRGITCYVSICL